MRDPVPETLDSFVPREHQVPATDETATRAPRSDSFDRSVPASEVAPTKSTAFPGAARRGSRESPAGRSSNASFHRFAEKASTYAGRPAVFGLAVAIVVVWAVSGPIFDFSETWQLVINTGTTIITFLMVFLIQNTQNRDSHAVQIKLDELIRAVEGADNALLDIEELEDEEIEDLRRRYEELAARARRAMEEREATPPAGTDRAPGSGDHRPR